MGSRGPIGKRSDQRVRRNKVEGLDRIEVAGDVEVPPLELENAHPIIADFYESLADSGQSQYYEPSDWQFARFTLHFANTLLQSNRPSAQMLAAVNAMLSNLLVAEGDRRRVRLEVERGEQQAQLYDVASLFEERLAQ
jgi:hypothetical protein